MTVEDTMLKTKAPAFALLLLLSVTTPLQRNAQDRPPIIDVHVYAYAKDVRWTQKVANPLTGQAMTAVNEETHMQATFAEMKNDPVKTRVCIEVRHLARS